MGITKGLNDVIQVALEDLNATYEEYEFLKGLESRNIYLNSAIDLNLIPRIVHNIYRWNEEDEAKGRDGTETPITIHITSEGGCVFTMWSIINAIQNSKTKIIGKAYGMAASAGAYILIACHERYVQKDATVLLHAGSLSVAGDANAAKQTMKHYGEYDKRVKDLVLERTNISSQLYNRKSKDEWYEHGDACIELGIVDGLI